LEIVRKQEVGQKINDLELVKTVFFNLLVDVGTNRDDKVINRILRHYSSHFQRKHQDNKRRFLLKIQDFNHASDLIDELFLETKITLKPNPVTLSSLDIVPISLHGMNKKASIIKVDKPYQQDDVVKNGHPQIMRSSEPTPIKGEKKFFLKEMS